MSPEEHYAKAEELLEWAADDEYPERHFQDRDWLTASAQAHATMALFTPAVSINVQNLKSADEPAKVTGQDFLDALPAAHECFSEYVPPAPAEEETKAERRDPDELAKRMARIWVGGWDELEEDERDCLRCAAEIARAYYASSPVVPAPAEPAEEETKAERGPEWFREIADAVDEIEKIPGMYHSMTLRSWAGVFRNHADTLELASSPVVPAPTETGPWPTWESVPDDVWFTSTSAVGSVPAHRKRGSLVDWQFRDGSVGVYDVSRIGNGKLMARAPFVAAEKEEA